jgi:hypothetical protein
MVKFLSSRKNPSLDHLLSLADTKKSRSAVSLFRNSLKLTPDKLVVPKKNYSTVSPNVHATKDHILTPNSKTAAQLLHYQDNNSSFSVSSVLIIPSIVLL